MARAVRMAGPRHLGLALEGAVTPTELATAQLKVADPWSPRRCLWAAQRHRIGRAHRGSRGGRARDGAVGGVEREALRQVRPRCPRGDRAAHRRGGAGHQRGDARALMLELAALGSVTDTVSLTVQGERAAGAGVSGRVGGGRRHRVDATGGGRARDDPGRGDREARQPRRATTRRWWNQRSKRRSETVTS